MTDQMKSLLNIRQFPPTGQKFTSCEPPFHWAPNHDQITYQPANNQPTKRITQSGLLYVDDGKTSPKPIAEELVQAAFNWVSQFRSFGLGTDRFTLPGCCTCDNQSGYFEYQGIKLPAHFVPRLVDIFAQA